MSLANLDTLMGGALSGIDPELRILFPNLKFSLNCKESLGFEQFIA
jgi:hypothetical protein